MSRPKILGVAHLAVFVSDLPKARAFYGDLLGFDEPFTLPKPDGSVDIAFVKINDRQWIELFNQPSAGEGQLNHIAIYTDNADGMRDYLASQGVAVPETVAQGPHRQQELHGEGPRRAQRRDRRVPARQLDGEGRGQAPPADASLASRRCTSASSSATSMRR